jgi:hypothetical protein
LKVAFFRTRSIGVALAETGVLRPIGP